ncbi:hypothetical protein [Draconibacterium halophilum]|uniref:Uncharacterized protein n=1 Tax=Draconibacterium halophilum TaxID=2706887 RepID=A0A6C0R9K7_9BACT|nr:hypothetical protein [Draconibacterium halophilum]QIA06375.1 hypothetical protein G0Q07_00900 [Draconibacterium halophilum]
MKKLVFLLAAVLVTAFSSGVFAQSSGENPAPGATHSYFIADNPNTSVSWYVTKGSLDSANITNDVTISASTLDTTDITWATTVQENDWYYVHVIETDDNTLCSNEKVLPVQIIANPFYLTISGSENACYNGAVTASIDGTDAGVINYDHGSATISFSVAPSGLSSSYNGYDFSIGIDFNSYSGTLDDSDVSVSSNATIDNSGNVSVEDNNEVIVTYVIDNQTTFTNVTDADGTAADFTATATISSGKTSNGISDNGASSAYNDNTFVSRPHTTGIGTN